MDETVALWSVGWLVGWLLVRWQANSQTLHHYHRRNSALCVLVVSNNIRVMDVSEATSCPPTKGGQQQQRNVHANKRKKIVEHKFGLGTLILFVEPGQSANK